MPRTLFSLALLLAGCGVSSAESLSSDGPYQAAADPAMTPTTEATRRGEPQGGAAVTVERKLIRTGNLAVTVDEYAPFRSELDTWMTAHGGYIADANLNHYDGQVGWAHLNLRVPVDQFDALVQWTEGRVEVGSVSIDSQDVTEQWVDLDARLTNMKRTEVRLAQLLEHDATTLSDVLALETELARVRGDIESLEGRLRVLEDQIQLASLTLDLSVRRAYAPRVAQPFGAQITDTFSGSVAALQTFAAGSVLIGVAITPWAAVFAGFLALLALFGRFAWRSWRGSELV